MDIYPLRDLACCSDCLLHLGTRLVQPCLELGRLRIDPFNLENAESDR